MSLLTNDTLPNYSFLEFGSSGIGLHVGTNEILGSRYIGANEASEFMMRPRNGSLLYIYKNISCLFFCDLVHAEIFALSMKIRIFTVLN